MGGAGLPGLAGATHTEDQRTVPSLHHRTSGRGQTPRGSRRFKKGPPPPRQRLSPASPRPGRGTTWRFRGQTPASRRQGWRELACLAPAGQHSCGADPRQRRVLPGTARRLPSCGVEPPRNVAGSTARLPSLDESSHATYCVHNRLHTIGLHTIVCRRPLEYPGLVWRGQNLARPVLSGRCHAVEQSRTGTTTKATKNADRRHR